MTSVMLTATKEVYDVTRRGVANPWTIEKEEEIERSKKRIKVAVKRRNENM